MTTRQLQRITKLTVRQTTIIPIKEFFQKLGLKVPTVMDSYGDVSVDVHYETEDTHGYVEIRTIVAEHEDNENKKQKETDNECK